MSEKGLEEIATLYLAVSVGCPTDEKFMKQNEDCKNCSEYQDLQKCWRNYLIWYDKEEG